LEAKTLAATQAYAAEILDGPSRPGVARAFLRILDTESEGYRVADDHRFVFPAPAWRNRRNPPWAVSALKPTTVAEDAANGWAPRPACSVPGTSRKPADADRERRATCPPHDDQRRGP
jgi:hypothetical protein